MGPPASAPAPRETKKEVERIRRVFAEYHAQGGRAGLWCRDNRGNALMQRELSDAIRQALARHGFLPLDGRRVLDVGCGAGVDLVAMTELGAREADLVGIDLFAPSIEEARRRHPGVRFEVGNGEDLHFEAASFDLVMLYTVVSAILDEGMALNLAAEVRRVLKPEGAVLWYDLRYPSPNPNVRPIRRQDLARYFPAFEPSLRPITVLPPLVRRLGPLASFSYALLRPLRFASTNYAGLLLAPRNSTRST